MRMPETARELDIVLYGATGFVGRLTAQYLAQAAAGVRIGLAGRSAARLQTIRDGLGAAGRDWPILIADAAEPTPPNRRRWPTWPTAPPW